MRQILGNISRPILCHCYLACVCLMDQECRRRHTGENARSEKRIMSYGWATSSLGLMPHTGKLFSDDVSAAPSLTTIIRKRNHLPPTTTSSYLRNKIQFTLPESTESATKMNNIILCYMDGGLQGEKKSPQVNLYTKFLLPLGGSVCFAPFYQTSHFPIFAQLVVKLIFKPLF